MANEQNKAIAHRFIQELFSEGKVDEAKNFVTPDVVYHGLEDVRGLEDFKKWIIEEHKSFPICRSQ